MDTNFRGKKGGEGGAEYPVPFRVGLSEYKEEEARDPQEEKSSIEPGRGDGGGRRAGGGGGRWDWGDDRGPSPLRPEGSEVVGSQEIACEEKKKTQEAQGEALGGKLLSTDANLSQYDKEGGEDPDKASELVDKGGEGVFFHRDGRTINFYHSKAYRKKEMLKF